jgi:hypothetical protein
MRSYSRPANAYISKSVDFENFIEAIRQIDDFYLRPVKLPRGSRRTSGTADGGAAARPQTVGDARGSHADELCLLTCGAAASLEAEDRQCGPALITIHI